MIKIAITSVGSLVGQNILDSLEHRRAGIEIVGINSIASAAANFRCDRAYLAPPAARSDSYLQRLATIVHDECPDLVLPGRDDDVVLLAQLKESRPALRTVIPVGPRALAEVIDDKWASYGFALRHSLPYVDSAPSDDPSAVRQLIDRYGFPLIAKPRSGNGSRGVRVIFDDTQCAAVRSRDNCLLQPYLEPEPDLLASYRHDADGVPLFHAPVLQQIACQCIIEPGGEIAGVFCTLVDLVMGRLERAVWIGDVDVSAVVHRYAQAFAAAGWVGTLNLQGRRNRDGVFCVYELNGRFTGGTTARLHLGFDEVGMLIASFVGRPIPAPGKTVGMRGIVTKSLTEFAVTSADVGTLETVGFWQRKAARESSR